MKNYKTPTAKKKTFVKKETPANPFLEMIIDGMKNLEQEQWEHYLKHQVDFTPKNLFTQKPYMRFNRFILMLDMIRNQFDKAYYATFNQISQAGGRLKKGSKSVVIQYYNVDVKHKVTKVRISLQEYLQLSVAQQEQYDRKAFIKYFRVFNIAHIENLEEVKFDAVIDDETQDLTDINLSEDAELFINKLKENKGLNLIHKKTNLAFYTPSTDIVTMPNTEYFKDDQKYYSTLFHELIHWTGHESRLKRFDVKATSREKYAVEELIAEMGAMLIYFDYNFKEEFTNSLVYLKGWVKSTDQDKDRIEVLSEAFKLSNKAVNFLYK